MKIFKGYIETLEKIVKKRENWKNMNVHIKNGDDSALLSVWGMRLGINSQLFSISEFSTDLKRMQTPHSLLRDFGADKTLQLVGQAAGFKFEFKG